MASNVSIENGFANTIVNGNGTYFPRQPGGFTLAPQNATMALKGIGYQYDVTFDITAAPEGVPGDYNANGTVDAADYVLWRKGDPAADGDGSTVVDRPITISGRPASATPPRQAQAAAWGRAARCRNQQAWC